MISQTEENYLKAIFKLSEATQKPINTNAISVEMNTAAASVTDMIKRLSDKELIHYEKYKGVKLSQKGKTIATDLVRRHRLWEVFLLEKLGFAWDEVHDVAEELEHIKSDKLIDSLDSFLDFPKFDPHGDPIPDSDGNIQSRQQTLISKLEVDECGVLVGVYEHSKVFLQYLDKLGLNLGVNIKVLEKVDYDQSVKVLINETKEEIISKKVSQNLFIKTTTS